MKTNMVQTEIALLSNFNVSLDEAVSTLKIEVPANCVTILH